MYYLKLVAVLMLFPALFIAQNEGTTEKIHWLALDEAAKLAKENPKPIIMDVYTPWCGPCKMMMKNTFSNSQIIEYVNENFYAVKFNAEGPKEVTVNNYTFKNEGYDPNRRGRNATHELSRSLKITGYPTLVFFNEKLEVLQKESGYKTPQQLEIFLKYYGSGVYKTVAGNEFQKNFKPEIK